MFVYEVVSVAHFAVARGMMMLEFAYVYIHNGVAAPWCVLLVWVLLQAVLERVPSNDVLDGLVLAVPQIVLPMWRLEQPLLLRPHVQNPVELLRVLLLGFCALAGAFCLVNPWSNLISAVAAIAT